jgi:hypothetical protein
MVAVADRVARPYPHGCCARPEHFQKALKAPCPLHGDRQSTSSKTVPPIAATFVEPSASRADTAPKDDTEFPEANHCLMIFEGS